MSTKGDAVKATVQIVSIVAMLAMALAIGYAFIAGDFGREGAVLGAMPWGIVSLVDLYAGFALFACWVVYREASRPAAIVWVLLILVLGNLMTAAYVFWALRTSGGDPRRFFFGARA